MPPTTRSASIVARARITQAALPRRATCYKKCALLNRLTASVICDLTRMKSELDRLERARHPATAGVNMEEAFINSLFALLKLKIDRNHVLEHMMFTKDNEIKWLKAELRTAKRECEQIFDVANEALRSTGNQSSKRTNSRKLSPEDYMYILNHEKKTQDFVEDSEVPDLV